MLRAAWGALLGRRLSQRGVLVFCLDYRNFPQVGGAQLPATLVMPSAFCFSSLASCVGDS